MKLSRKNGSGNIGAMANSAIVLLLLVLYIFSGNGQLQNIHRALHAHDSVEVHSPKDESNPCHVSEYHPSQENACHHNTHISSDEKCSLCGFSFHSEHIEFIQPECSHQIFFEQKNIFYASFLIEATTQLYTSRGPPSLI